MKKKFFLWPIGIGLAFAGIVIASFPAPVLTQSDPSEKLLKVTFDSPFTLHFSQIMQKESVERAFSLSPEIKGEFSWKDLRTLEFRPAEPLTIGDEYRLTMGRTARSIWMKSVGFDTSLHYVVTGPPFVLFADPKDQAPVTGGAITVMFDRPMELAKRNVTELIQSEPEMDGEIRLMGMSAFQLIPQRLTAGKSYSLLIPAGLSAVDGGTTKEAYSWTVMAPSLKILETQPETETPDADTSQALMITFNEAVDLNGIKPGINALLFPSNDIDAGNAEKMDGFFNTEVTYATDEAGEPQKDRLVFTPTFDYLPGRTYRFLLKSDAGLPLEEDYELTFTTASEGRDSALTDQKTQEKSEEPVPALQNPVAAESQYLDSLFEYASPMRFFLRGENPKLKLKKALSEQAELSVCQIPSNQYIQVSAQNGWSSFVCPDTEPVLLDPANMKDTLTLDLSQYSELDWVTGVYFSSLKTGSQKSVQLFMVEDTALYMKQSSSDLFVWALDIKSGTPLSGMELEVLRYDGSEAARGTTDNNGVFSTDLPFEEGLYVRGKKDGEGLNRWGLVSGRWTLRGEIPAPDAGHSGLVVLLNQNTFSPGDPLYFKGIWRTVSDHALALPEASQVLVSLAGDRQNLSEPKRVPLRRNGSFDDSFVIPLDVLPGLYHLTVSDVNNQLLTEPLPFMIRPASPDLTLEWLEAKQDYPAGSAPVLVVQARYKNGIPAAGAAGEYQLFRKPFRQSYEEGAIVYSFAPLKDGCSSDCGSGTEEAVVSRTFTFDQNGTAQLILTDEKDGFLESGYNYEVQVSASFEGVDPALSSHSFRLHQGSFDLGLGLKHAIVRSAAPIEVSLLGLDFDGHPASGNKVHLSLIENSGKGKSVHGTTVSLIPDSYSFNLAENENLSDGVYLLRAETQDERSNTIRAEQWLFLNRKEDEAFDSGLFLAYDQPKYYVGGRAHLLINDPSASKDRPVQALVSYERNGLLGFESLNLSAPVTEINVPIKENMFPGFTVTVTRFNRGVPPTYSSASRTIEVGNDDAAIYIDLDFSPETPAPGQEVTLTFSTRDYQNQPMPSVLTVNVLTGDPRNSGLSYLNFYPAASSVIAPASSVTPSRPEAFSAAVVPEEKETIFHPVPAQSVFFNPVLATDITGKAVLTFTLPERKNDLTVEVFATKNESFFGYGTSVLQLNHRLLIRPVLPDFAVPGDRTLLGASVKNLSDLPIHSRLTLVSQGIAKGDYSRNFSLEPGQQTEISFSVLVDPLLQSDYLNLSFSSEADSVQSQVPLRHLKSSLPVSDGVPIENAWSSLVVPPKGSHPGPGLLSLTLSGSPLAVAKVRADALEMCEPENNYLVAARLLSDLAFLPASPSDNDLVSARALLSTLLSSAGQNGAYRFRNESNPSPFLSATALWAASAASVKGLPVDPVPVGKTVEFLWQALDRPGLSPEERFFILWSLSLNGQYDTERSLTLFRESPELSTTAKAYLLLNLDRLVQAGQGSLASLIDTLKADLASGLPPDRKSSAILLFALSTVSPDNPVLKPLAESIFAERDDLLREPDLEEALWTILSLKQYAAVSGAAPVNFIARVKLAGSLILDQSVTKSTDLFESDFLVKTLYSGNANDLSVRKEGTDPLYLDAHLMTFLNPAESVRTENRMLILRQIYEVNENGEVTEADSFRKGKHYLSELEFIVPQDAANVVLTEEIPAGFRAKPGLSEFFSASAPDNGRVIYFAPSLKAGIYKVNTDLWAVLPGTYLQLPSVLRPMFESSAVGRTAGGVIQILE